MFKRKKKDPTSLDVAIENALSELAGHDADSDEYANITNQLVKLYGLKEIDNPDRRISNDVLAGIAANLIGIGMIISYERVHVITTKALGFIVKTRI